MFGSLAAAALRGHQFGEAKRLALEVLKASKTDTGDHAGAAPIAQARRSRGLKGGSALQEMRTGLNWSAPHGRQRRLRHSAATIIVCGGPTLPWREQELPHEAGGCAASVVLQSTSAIAFRIGRFPSLIDQA